MKAVVIGGNGFIGTSLVEHLVEKGYQTRVFDKYPSRFMEPIDGVEYMVGGDLGNHGDVQKAVAGMDIVFHLAYTTLPETSNNDPIYDVRSNLVDTLQLVQESLAAKVKKFVFISSGGTVYGVPKSVPIKEDHPNDPICSYGITKLAIEKYLSLYHQLHNLDYVVARIANPYGERQNPDSKQGAIGVFLGRIKADKPITIFGDGEVVRDFIYISDAAKAIIACGEFDAKKGEPRVFNIGSGKGYSLSNIVETIKLVVDVPVKVERTPARSLDVPSNVLDIDAARKYLKWEPQIDLKEGIEKAWNWAKSLSVV
ncbi:NAD-dependent epimerase/dehydratase family protein [bacterium]|nr:NAD-dependent epimerase/dehydratase family protein [bacterium]QQR56329.1 MAG: NAD-dependent epimerase/dehydratase family protein [Candidatus Melainabacteria bacterium]